ncbi:MAG: ISNCY family transposase [Terriglobales bacterium]
MRRVQQDQMKLGEVAVSKIALDVKSRDEIPKLLMGLRHIYCTPELRAQVFGILEDIIPKKTDKNNGRLGMDLWNILVLATLRLNCDWDYDKLREMADNHKTLRQMLGHGIDEEDKRYPLQTLKDNVSLLTPEALDRINQVVVQSGHTLVRKKKDDILRGRCDSFVVETNVHFPTDINLLFDAVRKMIELTGKASADTGLTTWRQSRHNVRTVKRSYRRVQNLKRSTSRHTARKAEAEERIKEAHQDYVSLAGEFVARAEGSMQDIRSKSPDLKTEVLLLEIEGYIKHARRQMDQITRRVVGGEKIPHEEKVFSIFEPHTDWICKGKAGVPQELGLRVGIVEDQYQFILHHRVMEEETDDKVAVPMIRATRERFPEFKICSLDKGYHSPENKTALSEMLERVVMPKKGKLSRKEKEAESAEEHVRLRRKHSAVESAINALENHGLDRCPDHGIYGFKRYVALAVVARNLQHVGHILQQKELKRQARHEKRTGGQRLAAA